MVINNRANDRVYYYVRLFSKWETTTKVLRKEKV